MKTMEETKFENMTDGELAIYLRDYASTRLGEIRTLTLAAANRILHQSERIKELQLVSEDDGK